MTPNGALRVPEGQSNEVCALCQPRALRQAQAKRLAPIQVRNQHISTNITPLDYWAPM